MILPSDARSIRQSLIFAFLAHLAAIGTGAAVLAGWTFDVPILKRVIVSYGPMMPNTAVAFIAAGVALGLNGAWRRRETSSWPAAARTLAGGIAILGGITLWEYVTGVDLGIDRLLFPNAVSAESILHPGRMAAISAAGFLFLGAAIFFQDRKLLLSQVGGLATVVIGLLGSTGYLYRAESLVRTSTIPIAFHTSLVFLAMGAGTLFSRPRRGLVATATSGYLGGMAARRILPLAIAVPVATEWLRLAGERAGFYGIAEGASFFATSTVMAIVVLVWLSARSVNAIDERRAMASEAMRQSTSQLQSTHLQLIESEERFRRYMEHLPASAFLKDPDGRYIWGSPGWRRQFPTEWGELIGKTDVELWPPETCAVFQASDRQVLETKEPVQLVESSKVGTETNHWMATKFPIQGSNGTILIGGISFDVTERKQLETQLFQAQKLEAIGLLAGGVAHDFNNLLTVILGFADEVKLDFETARPPYENLEEIQAAARKAAALTTQLLAFGRKQVMQPRILQLNDTLADVQRMLRRVLREDIRLQLSLGPDTGKVQADPVQIQQVLINLTMNAQDAMPNGGRITIETSNVELDESYVVSHRQVQPGPYVMLAVSDTGTGIEESLLTHIFEPFFTTKAIGKGTGLGLATVYGIVKQSGGYIWVYSEPGKGATFKIYLPRVGAPLDAVEAPPSPAAPDSHGRTILIAEDEDAVRMLMIKACSKAGYRLLAATNGEEAMSLAASHPGVIDLLLTDVIMPGMNGRALADQVTRMRPETKVLYCSGYAENAIVHHGVLNTQATFLPKPFTSTALLQAVREILTGRY